ALDEAGPGDAQRHRLGIVAVDAAHRMRVTAFVELLTQILITVLIALFEPGHRIAAAELAIERHDRGMTMQAGSRLRLAQALGRLLVREHVGMTPAVAVVDRERVAEEHAFQPRIALDLLLRQRLAAAVAPEPRLGGERGPEVAVVLGGPVAPPDRRKIGRASSRERGT